MLLCICQVRFEWENVNFRPSEYFSETEAICTYISHNTMMFHTVVQEIVCVVPPVLEDLSWGLNCACVI